MPINHRLAILDTFGTYFATAAASAVGSGLLASLKCQLCQFAYAENLTTSKITVQVAKVGLQVFKRFLLRPVIGILLQVAEPVVFVLPIDVFGGFHGAGHY